MIQDLTFRYSRFVIDPAVGGAIVTGVSSLLGSGLNAMQNAKSYSRWRRSFDHAHRANIEDWNMQNEYNLPLNQLKRLRDAGINPNFAIQTGGVTAQGGSISPASGSDLHQESIGDPIASAGLQIGQMIAQKDNIKADTDFKKAQTEGQQIQNELDRKYGGQQRESSVSLNRAMANLSDKQAMSIVKTIDEQIRVLRSTANRNEAEERELNALLEFRKQLMTAQTNSANASANLSNTLAEEEPKRTEIQSRGVSATERANEIRKLEVENDFKIKSKQLEYQWADLAERTKYDENVVRIQKASSDSLGELQHSESLYTDSKRAGQEILNKLGNIDYELKDYLHKHKKDIAEWDAKLEFVNQQSNYYRNQVEKIQFDKKMTEFQKGIELQKLMIEVNSKSANFLQNIIPSIPMSNLPK